VEYESLQVLQFSVVILRVGLQLQIVSLNVIVTILRGEFSCQPL